VESAGGRVSGSYQRRVTLFNQDGRPVPCARAPLVEQVDRYAVRGWRDGDALVVEETGASPGRSPCAGPERHLDSAQGRVYRDSIELVWRGQNRQVLTREPAALPAQKTRRAQESGRRASWRNQPTRPSSSATAAPAVIAPGGGQPARAIGPARSGQRSAPSSSPSPSRSTGGQPSPASPTSRGQRSRVPMTPSPSGSG